LVSVATASAPLIPVHAALGVAAICLLCACFGVSFPLLGRRFRRTAFAVPRRPIIASRPARVWMRACVVASKARQSKICSTIACTSAGLHETSETGRCVALHERVGVPQSAGRPPEARRDYRRCRIAKITDSGVTLTDCEIEDGWRPDLSFPTEVGWPRPQPGDAVGWERSAVSSWSLTRQRLVRPRVPAAPLRVAARWRSRPRGPAGPRGSRPLVPA
jgi:hypothetical protein